MKHHGTAFEKISIEKSKLHLEINRKKKSVGVRNDKVITSQSWEGLSILKVRVQSAELQEHSITFVLRRAGLGWKLAALER